MWLSYKKKINLIYSEGIIFFKLLTKKMLACLYLSINITTYEIYPVKVIIFLQYHYTLF